jgi:hypothetical protein
MSENFENELRRALRPLDAPAGFTEKVMRSLPATREPAPAEPRADRSRGFAQRFRIPAAFAATFLVALLLGLHVKSVNEQRIAAEKEAAGLAASRELMQALHVTSQKLDLVYQASKASPAEPATPAGEENRT